jgi:hypothetical protein
MATPIPVQPNDPATDQDPLGRLFGGLGFGTAIGTALQGLVTWLVRTLQAGQPMPAKPDLGGAPALVLLFGTMAAAMVAAFATWRILAPLRNVWRQGMLSIVVAFGSFVVSLLAIPLDRAFGRAGLATLIVGAGLAALLIGRRLARA